MQRTTQAEGVATSTSLYDSQTVRDVLGRATQIETQEQNELLDADQVEALGKELGLSPDAVRRALGEIAGKSHHAVTSKTARRSTASTTKEEAKDAYVPIVWYLLLSFPVMFFFTKITAMGGTATMGIVLLNTALALLLSLRFGYLTRSARVGAVGGALTVVLAPVLVALAFSLVWQGYIPDRIKMFLWFIIVLGAIAGALGAGMRNWWESLPSKNDR